MDRDFHDEGQAHQPVLRQEVVEWLRPEREGTIVDCTVGLGGHAEALLEASTKVRVVGIDRDTEALEIAERRLASFGARFRAVHGNFRDIAEVLAGIGVSEVAGVLADLGVSSLQFDKAERGFSFGADAPLDMRMDTGSGETAAELIESMTEGELADLIFEYGEERGSRKIARAIVRARQKEPITTTSQLADIVVRALNIPGRWRIHPATRTFQAIRIAVNQEMQALESFLPAAISMLGPGARLAVISFHSLEDRIVKRRFLLESGRCLCNLEGRGPMEQAPRKEVEEGGVVCSRCGAAKRVQVLTRKPQRATREEIERNPRSRSALLRVCERF
jgi:16S rRNA (cytosine1402-N4)-methyltransferase